MKTILTYVVGYPVLWYWRWRYGTDRRVYRAYQRFLRYQEIFS